MDPDKSTETTQQGLETRSHAPDFLHAPLDHLSIHQLFMLEQKPKRHVQMSYAEKEAKMMKKKAELEANLHVLQKQRAVVAALAEAAVYEAAVEWEELLKDLLELAIQDKGPVSMWRLIL